MKRLALGLGLMAGIATGASAQEAPKDFLFQPPVGSVAFRIGYMGSSANSDAFAFAQERFNVHKRDFGGVNAEGELAFRVPHQLEMTVTAGYSVAYKESMYRDWVDNDDKPIEQATSFSRTPVTVNLRYNILKSGRTVGSFAFIPSKYSAYVGAGVGLVYHTFRQSGDFIDFQDMSVFNHRYESTGFASLRQVMAGVTYSVNAHMAVETQAKYVRAASEMGPQWIGFDKIDLSGVGVTSGVRFRF